MGKTYEYYTDGAASMKKIDGKWVRQNGGNAWVLVENNVVVEYLQNGNTNTTNNEQELLAIYHALDDFKGKFKLRRAAATDIAVVYSDSSYAINVCSEWMYSWQANGWRRKRGEIENLQLIQNIFDLIAEIGSSGGKVIFRKVSGHSDVYGNIIADKLAVEAKEKQVTKYWWREQNDKD